MVSSGCSKMKNASFWTFCPYCYYLYEYESSYEEYSLRCQNCKRAFHGVSIGEPPASILVKGKEEYYFCWAGAATFNGGGSSTMMGGPTTTNNNSDTTKKDEATGPKPSAVNMDNVIEISSSDDDSDAMSDGKTSYNVEEKENGIGLKKEESFNGDEVKKSNDVVGLEKDENFTGDEVRKTDNGRRRKTLASNTTKLFGTGEKRGMFYELFGKPSASRGNNKPTSFNFWNGSDDEDGSNSGNDSLERLFGDDYDDDDDDDCRSRS